MARRACKAKSSEARAKSGEAHISWPKSTAPISAQPRGRPMWPELAFLMESMARPRASSAACGVQA